LLQEIAYRGFLFPKLQELSQKWWVVIGANTVLFTFLHIIYPIPGIMLPVAFFSGLALSIMYRYYPNLILISLAHAVLNFIAVLHGFFFFHE
jgi:membrane protease YdiL (CAAX protease family)